MEINATFKINTQEIRVSMGEENANAFIESGKQSEYNAFWDGFQNYGNRNDYSYCFANSSQKEICPKYPIETNNAMYMFMNCTELIYADNITVHLTVDKPNMMYTLAQCNKLLTAPIFIYDDVSVIKAYMSMYAGCYALQSVNVYWGNGSADPVTQRNACNNMFFKCWNLKDIDFGGNETGSPLNLDLSYATELTIESIVSLLNSLQNIPAGSAGDYVITLATETVENLQSSHAEILTGFKNKGWTIQTESREQ